MTQLEILKQYNDGDMKPSKAYVQLRAIKSELEDIIKQVEEGLVDEITRMGTEDLVDGFKISHMKGRESLDYKASDVYNQYSASLKEVQEKLKQATKLKVDIVDPETGEVYEPLPTKYGAGFIKMERARMEVV
jgi:hypothetical protein